MLRPAVLLDSAMTVTEARVRLAQHGYWSSLDEPNARAVLQAYLDRIAAAAIAGQKRSSPLTADAVVPQREGGAPAPSDVPLEANTARTLARDIAAAAAALSRPIDEGRVAVRRTEGTRIYWYARTVKQLLDAFAESSVTVNVRDALGLHEYRSLRTVQLDTLASTPTAMTNFDAVVLRGTEFVGIAQPDVPGTNKGVNAPNPVGFGDTRSTAAPAVAARSSVGAEHAHDGQATVQAYPNVLSPDYVTVAEPFEVVIGLGPAPMAGELASGRIELRAAPDESTIDVDVQVVAEGFGAPGGWSRVLRVTITDPFAARVTVGLVAELQDVDTRPTTITVHYAVGGVTRGSLVRRIVVLRSGVAGPAFPGTAGTALPPNEHGTDWLATQPAPPAMTVVASTTVPDIEVNLAKPDGNAAGGLFYCTLRNAHGLPVPDAPLPVNLGSDARTFAKLILDEMPRYDGMPLLEYAVKGHGATIAEKLPKEFWSLLRAVATKIGDGQVVTLQFNSADAYVPWELALVDPPIYADRVPLLAAQTTMGRWILGESAVASPPRAVLHVRSFALMAGMYKAARTGMMKLPKAEEEVQELEATYAGSRRALAYTCDGAGLTALLGGSIGGGAQLVHFAGHGQVDPARPGDAAIYLNDGLAISPVLFRKTALGSVHSPLLFLNACMVGTAGEMLGDFGGFPGNCLAGNFTGLVAPLWAVNDEIAKWMALEFYRDAMASPPRSVAAILRDLRSTFASRPQSSSYLAYVYYGNPYLTLA